MERGTHTGRMSAALAERLAGLSEWLLAARETELLAREAPVTYREDWTWLPGASGGDPAAHVGVITAARQDPGHALLCVLAHRPSCMVAELVRRAMQPPSGTAPLSPHVLVPCSSRDDAGGRADDAGRVLTVTPLPVVPRYALLAGSASAASPLHGLDPGALAVTLHHAAFQLHHGALALCARFPRAAFGAMAPAIELLLVTSPHAATYRVMLPSRAGGWATSEGVLRPDAHAPAVFAAFAHWHTFAPAAAAPQSALAITAGAVRVLLHRAYVHAALEVHGAGADAVLLQAAAESAAAAGAALVAAPGTRTRALLHALFPSGALPPAAASLGALLDALDDAVSWGGAPGGALAAPTARDPAAAGATARALLLTAYPFIVWAQVRGEDATAHDADAWRGEHFDGLAAPPAGGARPPTFPNAAAAARLLPPTDPTLRSMRIPHAATPGGVVRACGVLPPEPCRLISGAFSH